MAAHSYCEHPAFDPILLYPNNNTAAAFDGANTEISSVSEYEAQHAAIEDIKYLNTTLAPWLFPRLPVSTLLCNLPA